MGAELMQRVPKEELDGRMAAFVAQMDARCPDWQAALITSRVNQYYLSGCMQDALLVVRRGEAAMLFVRRDLRRAREESLFQNILPMESYRDAAAAAPVSATVVYLETETTPLAMAQRLQRAFGFAQIQSMDAALAYTRAVKSPYELERMRRSGEIHRRVLCERVPALLREGMTEAALAVEIYRELVQAGHHGVSRFGMFGAEFAVGQIAFGENSLSGTSFNGPGGAVGLTVAAPVLGSRERKLCHGDLVFVDVGCGVEGYHTDCTMTYVFGGQPSPQAVQADRACADVEARVQDMLRPGQTPQAIYRAVMTDLAPILRQDFMGFGARRVKFLGHGVGLQIDELPVLAEGFQEPIQAGMVFAVEPKRGIAGFGMVGRENTFLVEKNDTICLTAPSAGLCLV